MTQPHPLPSVLLVAPIPIDQQRTGPAIRYWEFARVLSAGQPVTLLVENDDHPTHPDFRVCTCAAGELDALLASHQVVVVQGPAMQKHPRLAQLLASGGHYLVVDLYDPITLEQLAIDPGTEAGRWLHLEYWALLNEQLRLGDFFLCASERQRDYWLGALCALGRVNHDTWQGGDLRRLVDVVPFGLPSQLPRAGEPVLKGVVPGIAPRDRVILWGGGLWDWLDPLTPVRAMARVASEHPAARLVFFRSARSQTALLGRTRALAAELGLLDSHVLFADWLPPEQWGACLLEADVGLSFHHPGVETRFAFRTRLLDYIWAGLPIVTARGDLLGRLVVEQGLGHAVEPGDVEGVAGALLALLDDPQARRSRQPAFQRLAARLTWERVTEPLIAYCRQPWRAGDAGQSLAARWEAAGRDRILSDAAHAERQRARTEAWAGGLAAERDEALVEARQLREQLDDLAGQLRDCEDRFSAAMGGRVMRLMTGIQQALRRLGGRLR